MVSATPWPERAIDALRGQKLRIAAPRLALIASLDRSERPMTAQELHAVCEVANGPVDLVTVYRTLTVFEEIGLIHRVGDRGFMACQVGCGHDQTAHLLCDSCGRAEEVALEMVLDAETIERLRGHGFQAARLTVSVHGKCEKCD